MLQMSFPEIHQIYSVKVLASISMFNMYVSNFKAHGIFGVLPMCTLNLSDVITNKVYTFTNAFKEKDNNKKEIHIMTHID